MLTPEISSSSWNRQTDRQPSACSVMLPLHDFPTPSLFQSSRFRFLQACTVQSTDAGFSSVDLIHS
jgi:hypothetical protein